MFVAEHNALLRNAATMEKTLAAAVKGRDEAIAARDEAQRREEDLRASFTAREKLFEEQIFSIARALLGILLWISLSFSAGLFAVGTDILSMCGFMPRCWRLEFRPAGPSSR